MNIYDYDNNEEQSSKETCKMYAFELFDNSEVFSLFVDISDEFTRMKEYLFQGKEFSTDVFL